MRDGDGSGRPTERGVDVQGRAVVARTWLRDLTCAAGQREDDPAV